MEILNIDYNIKLLVLKALNTSKCNKNAAIKLGCSEKQLYNYKNKFNIILDKETLYYEEDIPRGSISAQVRRD